MDTTKKKHIQVVVDTIEDLISQSKIAKPLNICLKDANNRYIHSEGRVFKVQGESKIQYYLIIK
ncbi:MAG: hypothetical protein IIW54_14200, partial [Lachnospiraceae bacterium]|nr:hypothetical protein [Lachnospiraceae bacterium]